MGRSHHARQTASFGVVRVRPADRARLSASAAAFLQIMNLHLSRIVRTGALLAINLLFMSVWGFAAIGKLIDGIPSWFEGKFGKTFLASFPGLTATFWLLAVSELLAFALAVLALVCAEFLERKPAKFLPLMLVWRLFVFLQLGFGLWLTKDFSGAFQQFMYFSGTLVAVLFFGSSRATPAPPA